MYCQVTSEVLLLWIIIICKAISVSRAGGNLVNISTGVQLNGRYQQISDTQVKSFETYHSAG